MSNSRLIIMKPDAVKKGMVYPILQMLNYASINSAGAFFCRLSEEFWQDHYKHVKDVAPDWLGMCAWLASDNVCVLFIPDASPKVDTLKKDVRASMPHLIEGWKNLIHVSDNHETALIEYEKLSQDVRNTFSIHKTELENRIYAAASLFEELEHKGLITGNGHHAAQQVCDEAVKQLKFRFIGKDLIL